MKNEDEKTLIDALSKLIHNLEIIIQKLDLIIEKMNTKPLKSEEEMEKIKYENLPMDVATLLNLPDHLRKSAITLCNIGEATADMISKETRRARAAESDYLNQLVSLGYIKKKRIGRKVYFHI